MAPEPSFSQSIKAELAARPYRDEELRAALSAFVKINGTLRIREKKTAIWLKTENPAAAKFIHNGIEHLYGLGSRFLYGRETTLRKRTLIHIIIDKGAEDLLSDLEVDLTESKIAPSLVLGDELIAAYLAGAFLAAGSVNSPKSSNYHLEIALNDENQAKWFQKLIRRVKARLFEVRKSPRRRQFIVYLKRSDQIADFLIMIGATESALRFEDVRVDRDFHNVGNRLQNLDAANYKKTALAANRSLHDIAILERFISIKDLPNPKEALLCRLRKSNPDASLRELAVLLSRELDREVSRSNVSHLFRSLHERAVRYERAGK